MKRENILRTKTMIPRTASPRPRFPIPFFLLLLVFLFTTPIFSQETESDKHDIFWLSPSAEAALYSISSSAYGGSIALGYGSGSSIGFKAAYFPDAEGLSILEFNLLLRWYFMGRTSNSGPFIQLGCGPVFITEGNNPLDTTADIASISAGLCLGWRIPLGRRFFLEPNVRAGYPFFAGAGLSAGLNF
jgi:hypothetical protein